MSHRLHRAIPFILLALVAAGCSKHQEPKESGAGRSIDARLEPMGEELFNLRCRDCHKVKEKGGVVGPDLSAIGKRDRGYLEQVIREPSKVFPGTVMPSGDSLSAKQVKSLVDYLSTLK